MAASVTGTMRLRHAIWMHVTVTLLTSGGLAAYLVAPIWGDQPLRAAANWLAIVAFAVTAVLLAEEGEQTGNAWLFVGSAMSWAVGIVGAREIGPLPWLEWT